MSGLVLSANTFRQATDVWSRLRATLSVWRRRARERRELARVSARDLKDFGLTPGAARFEANKPFWRA